MDNQILLVCEYAICVATSFYSITQARKLRTLRTHENGNQKVMNIVPLQTIIISQHTPLLLLRINLWLNNQKQCLSKLKHSVID